MKKEISQTEFVLAYFKDRPKYALHYDDWADELASQYQRLTGRRAYHFRSVVRRLAGQGNPLKIRSGVYMYDPDYVAKPLASRFTAAQNRQIRARDEYRCVVCGYGPAEGAMLYVNFLFPDLKDRARIENGATFCNRHRLDRKGRSVWDVALAGLSQLIEFAEENPNSNMKCFAEDLRKVQKEYNSQRLRNAIYERN